MLTEDDARDKWCPFARYINGPCDPAPANRWKQDPLDGQPHALNPVPCRCIASDCMAWRWVGARIAFFDGDNGSGCADLTPDTKEKLGYCGLSGRPESR